MPDRGLLERATIVAGPIQAGGRESFEMEGVRLAQVTFEVGRDAALAVMPGDVGRPVPCYGRLITLEAAASDAGPLKLAALFVGGRYRMLPRNVLVDAIVDGPAADIASMFGSAYRPGEVSLFRDGARIEATVAAIEGALARVEIPALEAVDATMLRWDPWLGFGRNGDTLELVEYGPQPVAEEAFLSKGARLVTPAELPRTHQWRRLRNLNTISACYLEGAVTLTLPRVQQAIL